jgi:hypothetical protein
LRATTLTSHARDLEFDFAACDPKEKARPDINFILITREQDGARYCIVSPAKDGRPFMGTWQYGSRPPGLAIDCRPLDVPGRYVMEFSGSGSGKLEFEVDSRSNVVAQEDGC